MKKKIAILSDLHLESSNISLDGLDCDIIVLAGDISQDFSILYKFFSYIIPSDISVVYIPGNHEYEGKKYDLVLSELKKLELEFSNVHVLQNEAKVIDGIRFIGSTLWSNFEGGGITWKEEVKNWCKFNIVDFSYIFKKNNNNNLNSLKYTAWSTDDMENEFNKSYNFIKHELKNNPSDFPKFVVSHFAPCNLSIDSNYKMGLNSAYWVNHVPELLGFCDYWVHGHTHSSFDYEFHGTRIICNPRGYSKLYDLSPNQKFNKFFYVDVDVPENIPVNSKVKPI